MTRPPARRLAGAAVTLGTASAALLLGAPAASAAALPAPTLSTTTVPANQPNTYEMVSGSGCLDQQNHPGDIVIGGDAGLEIGDGGHAQADGTWSIKTLIGAGSTVGTHQILVTCDFYPAEAPYPPVTITVGTGAATATPTPAPAPKPLASVDRATFDKITNGTPFTLGERFKASYPGFKPFEVVTLVLHSTPQNVGTFTADASGVLTVSFTIPAGTASGSHSLTMTGNLGTSFAQALKVASSRSLAYTGTDVAAPLAIGGSLLLVGGALVFAARRRSAGAPRA